MSSCCFRNDYKQMTKENTLFKGSVAGRCIIRTEVAEISVVDGGGKSHLSFPMYSSVT